MRSFIPVYAEEGSDDLKSILMANEKLISVDVQDTDNQLDLIQFPEDEVTGKFCIFTMEIDLANNNLYAVIGDEKGEAFNANLFVINMDHFTIEHKKDED